MKANSAGAAIAAFLIAAPSQQDGPADNQNYAAAVPPKNKKILAAASLLPSKSHVKCLLVNNSRNKRKAVLENVVQFS